MALGLAGTWHGTGEWLVYQEFAIVIFGMDGESINLYNNARNRPDNDDVEHDNDVTHAAVSLGAANRSL